jgi:formylglycine-generating enzyme required for sulfatase activity
LEITDWLDGVPELSRSLPSIDSVKHRLARWQFLQPFRELVGSYFAGRVEELSRLADYVGFYGSAHLGESIGRTVEFIFSIHDRPPLFVNGPGGCGKSTLIAKFILQHAEIAESARFPFAYLDFDRPGLLAEEPVTLLMEVMRQLASQFPESRDEYRRMAEEWDARIADQQGKTTEVDRALGTNSQKLPSQNIGNMLRLTDRQQYMSEFVRFVGNIKRDEQPLLLVLDTFEEVQFRSSAFVEEVLEFLDRLQSLLPRLRTVLCGRMDISSSRFEMRKVEIGNFDEAAAISFLAGFGVKDSQIAQKIFEQVGGSPLVLRLAADVARLESVDQAGIDGLRTGWLLLFREKSVEVVLYKRILSHIRDKRVEQIAYPGLILRVISPEVLQNVLAPACGISLESLDDARELLSTMRAQLSTILTPSSGDELILVHRPDMRSILLHDLSEKAPKDQKLSANLTHIHETAIEFYSKYSDPAHRAEEIYHRLALGVDRGGLASRWRDGLKPYLGSSIRELRPASQIYLAARLNLELPADQWNQAEDEDWILYASRLATQQLQVGKAYDALSLLNQRRSIWDVGELQPVLKLVIDTVFHDYAKQYEKIRETQPAGPSRTRKMSSLVSEIGNVGSDLPIEESYAQKLYEEKRPGTRLVALAIIEKKPSLKHINVAIDAIEDALSPFEQYHALVVARILLDRANGEQRGRLLHALLTQRGTPIHESDPSRSDLKKALLTSLKDDKLVEAEFIDYALVEVSVRNSVVYRDDPNERHGPFVLTRGQHELSLPPRFRIGIYPVTNQQFLEFINDGGYLADDLWKGASRRAFLTQDKKTRGPSTWRSSKKYPSFPSKQQNHPVAGISYLEAVTFVRWLNHRYPDPDWLWCLPSEDMWEVSARSSEGFQYPWGSAFRPDHCNSLESAIKCPSDVARFPEGNSFFGCAEMAGNVWEFVEGSGQVAPDRCVMRGGSFNNNQYEVKSYLRLVDVPVDHRPPDFGIRCAQVSRSYVQDGEAAKNE